MRGAAVVTPAPVRPSDAVQMQDDLLRFWRSPAGSAYMRHWFEVRRRDGVPVYAATPEARVNAEVITLAGARLYLTTDDMLRVAEHAARSMPAQPLLVTDLPTPTGFFVLERGIVMPDVRGRDVVLSAFAWRRVMSGDREGVIWSYYADATDTRDAYVAEDPAARLEAVRALRARLVMLAEDAEVFGEAPATPEDITREYDYAAAPEVVAETLFYMRAVPLALLALTQSHVAEVCEERADRGTRRRLEREGSPVSGELSVVRLRRPHLEGDGAAPGAVDWSHRWIVSGHWRRAWRPSVGAHRLVWVAPFVKGPADRPLVVKRRVHLLER